MSSPTVILSGLVPLNLFIAISKLIGEQYPDAQMRNGVGGTYEFILTPEKEAN
ncbi:hypothetical protein [Scrofimicrobium canadense]|uniref:hypothetical protein n=1 Tax=Scrofimicrobium canadense TaxID=2652290 RepID=UPI0012B1E96C|nr:hypothetical protein [Scrofimicrobium canadense]